MKTNIFIGVSTYPVETAELNKIILAIKSGAYKDQITEYRDVLSVEPARAELIKKSLTAFTPAGTFDSQRRAVSISSYTGIIHLDYDKVGINKLEKMKIVLQGDRHTFGYFISPSGNGLKVFIATNANQEEHKEAFAEIRSYYDSYLGVESDSSVSDLSRLCFVSDDPDAYFNDNYLVYEVQGSRVTAENMKNPLDAKSIWEYTSRKLMFVKGTRNNFVYRFACNSNRQGLNIEEVLKYAYSYSAPDFSREEIENTISNVYKTNPHEYGSFAISTATTLGDNSSKTESRDEATYWDSSPLIPDDIYANLPGIIQDSCKIFKGRERDVVLTGLITVLGAALSNSWGLYDRKRFNPNLYSFVIAPAASGKGSMKHARDVVECYHQKIRELESGKSQKVFFIPANISASKFITHLLTNQGQGLIFETEADSLSGALKQEWGSFSDILRKGFHHETVSLSRRADNEYVEVNNPKFGICLSGTADQVRRLIKSQEDGLFSRFIYYKYENEFVWKNTFDDQIIDTTEYFFDINDRLCVMLSESTDKEIRLTNSQKGKFTKRFNELAIEYGSLNFRTSDILSRMGVICFKIIIVLSSLRSNDEVIYCTDEDFNSALKLCTEVYLFHSLDMAEFLTDRNHSSDPVSGLFKELPNEFDRQTAEKIASKFGLSQRTLTNYLNRLTANDLLIKRYRGSYVKA